MLPLAVLASAALLWRRLHLFGVAWLFAQVAPLAAAWYVLWGIPYAAATGTLAAFIVVMPLATALIDANSSLTLPGVALAIALGILLTIDVYQTTRHVAAPAEMKA